MVTQTDVNRTLVSVYNVLNIAGAVLLTLLLVASDIRRKNVFRSSKHDHNDVRRPSMWFIAIGSWIMLSISCCLLLGNQIGPPPPHGICLTQAVLVYSTPVLCVAVELSLLKVLKNLQNLGVRSRRPHSYCR